MNWKIVFKKLLFPPVWLMAILTAACAAGLVRIFLNGQEQTPLAYCAYALSFYTLSVDCVFCAMVLPKSKKQLRQKICSTPLGNRYMTDRVFRAKVSLHLSLLMNLLYVAVNLLSWYLYQSWWFVCLAVYYVIMSVMRCLLVRYVHENEIGSNRSGELKASLACSVILLTLNFFLTGAVMMIVFQDKGYDYHGILIYVMAMYTFCQTTHAIIDIIKYRKLESPVMSTAKVVSLASALVSMLNLETAMFAQFGAEMSKADQRLMIMLTGAGVALVVIVMSVYMVVRCTRELRNLRRT